MLSDNATDIMVGVQASQYPLYFPRGEDVRHVRENGQKNVHRDTGRQSVNGFNKRLLKQLGYIACPAAQKQEKDESIYYVSRFGLATAGKQKILGSIPLRLSSLFKKVVVCGHFALIVTFSFTVNEKH